MAAPTYVGDHQTVFNTITTPKTVSATATNGDLVYAFGVSEASGTVCDVPTGLTFTSVETAGTSGTFAYGRLSTSTATGNWTHSQSRSGSSGMFGGGVWIWRDSDGFDDTVSGTQAAGTAPSQDLVTVGDNCGAVVAVVDYNAIDGATRTWRTINGTAITEDLYYHDAAAYTVYVGHHPDVGAAGTKTVGLTVPASMKPTTVAGAVKGTAGGASTTLTPVLGRFTPGTTQSHNMVGS